MALEVRFSLRIQYSNSPSGISYLIPPKMDCYPRQNLVEITNDEIGMVKAVECQIGNGERHS